MKRIFHSIALVLILTFVSGLCISDKSLAIDKRGDKSFFKQAEKLKKKGGIFNLNLDILIGLGISNANFELNSLDTTTTGLKNTGTKAGLTLGANISVDFLGFGFTSGITYSSKGFETESGDNFNLNYFNIPLLFYFDYGIDRVLLEGNFGPYFGLLLSQDKSTVYSVKNFDLGLTGNIQGTYLLNKYLGALLGVKYEYGGLNNLVSNEKIKSVRTSTFFIYSGVKFIL